MEKLIQSSNTPMLTIIIPVYCVEAYIEKCVRSVLDSDYSEMEIILVDDGSTDSSGELCDKLAEQYKKIKVIHTENYGQSHARNVALDIAMGEYIGFVDSDDWVHTNMFSEMMKIAEAENADIVECNFNGRRYAVPDELEEDTQIKMKGREAIRKQLDCREKSRYPSTSVWSKIFRRGLLDGVRFPEGHVHEEFAFLCQAFCKAENYVYLNKSLYEHILREGSTTTEKFSAKSLDKLYVYQQRSEYLKSISNKELYFLSKEMEYELMIYLAGEAARYYMFNEEEKLRDAIMEEKEAILSSGVVKAKKKQYRLFFVSPFLYYTIRNISEILKHPKKYIIQNLQKKFTVKNILASARGENYYIIRCNQPQCGLFAIFMFILDHLAYAEDKGLIPVLKMQKRNCLYREKKKINGTDNPWEYYFQLPTEVSITELFRARTITYGQRAFLRYKGIYYYAEKNKNILPSKTQIHELHGLVEKYIRFQPGLQRELDETWENVRKKYHRMMGVHVRGTDMNVAGKQHNRPSVKLADPDWQQNIMIENNIDGIFLCTDDANVVSHFKTYFGDKVFCTGSVRQIEGKTEGVHFDKTLGNGRHNHKYLLGKEVITDMYLLSKCDILVCGPSNVAFAAMIYNDGAYEKIIYQI